MKASPTWPPSGYTTHTILVDGSAERPVISREKAWKLQDDAIRLGDVIKAGFPQSVGAGSQIETAIKLLTELSRPVPAATYVGAPERATLKPPAPQPVTQTKGYTEQPQSKIDAANALKELEERLLRITDQMKSINGHPIVDQRWLATGITDIQKGFSSLIRAIYQPERIALPEDKATQTIRIKLSVDSGDASDEIKRRLVDNLTAAGGAAAETPKPTTDVHYMAGVAPSQRGIFDR